MPSQDLGCTFGQGYHFARPLPYLEALQLIAQPALPAQRSAVPSRDHGDLQVLRRYGA